MMIAENKTLLFTQDGWLVEARALVWVVLERGDKVRDSLREGMRLLNREQQDLYAFVKIVPAGAQEFAEVEVDGTMVTVVQADWMPRGVVALGRGGQRIDPPVWAGVNDPYVEVENG
jgi:hypothetical protein